MLINKAILLYGHSNFSFEILEYCEKDKTIAREQHYLDTLPHEYNILETAGSLLGHRHSEEARKKMSEARLAYYTENPEARTAATAAATAAHSKAVLVTNTKTGETAEYISQAAAAKVLEVSPVSIHRCLKRKKLLKQT